MTLNPNLRTFLFRLSTWSGLFLLLTASLFAQTNGSLQGIVTDSRTQALLNGALVHLDGTSFETKTDSTGAYTFTALPPGNYSVSVSYLGLEPGTAQVRVDAGQIAKRDFGLTGQTITMAAFTVESVREGQARAINEQRTADTIKNIIASDAIGNLPDNTLGEALSRIAGVNVEQSEGEPSYVTIRGAMPQLNAVRVDGQGLPAITDSLGQGAGEDGRQTNLSLIPSEIVSSVEVVKALTPDTDADSIGGQVNIKTRSGFEVSSPVVSGSLDSYYSDLGQRWGWGSSFSFVGPLNATRTLGLGLDLNYRNIANDEQDAETVYYPKTDPSVSGIAGIKGDDAISEWDVRYRQDRKITFGGSANLDWKVSPITTLKFRTFYNASERYETKWRTRSAALTTFNANSTDTIASGTSARIRKLFYSQERAAKIYQAGFSGETRLDDGTLNYAASYNYTPQKSWLNRYDTDTISANRRLYSWTVNRTNPQVPIVRIFNTATGANGYDEGNDSLLQIEKQTGNDAERNYTGSADYSKLVRFGEVPVTFKFGGKYAGKNRKQRPILDVYGPLVAPLMKTFPAGSLQAPTNVLFGAVPTLGIYASQPAVFDAIKTNPSNYPILASNSALATIRARIYNVDEDVEAGYGMATARFGKLQAIAGLRYERTDNSYNWLSGNPHVLGSKNYDNYFPDFLLNYRFNRDQVLRAAWTHTLARPDYNQLVPYTLTQDPAPSIDTTPGTLTQIYMGNPDLRAAKSSNYDLSYEWYLKQGGVLSAGVFHKDISAFIYRRTDLKTINGTLTALHQFQNGGTVKENGMELSWSQALTMLPGALSGLGFVANTSLIEGKSTYYVLNPTGTNYSLVSEKFVPFQPRTTRNIQLYWEKYGFTARVAFNFVSDYVNPTDGHTPNISVASARRLDATIKYRVTKNFIVYLQGKNLRRQMQNWYDYNNPNLSEEIDYLGRSFVGGVKYHF